MKLDLGCGSTKAVGHLGVDLRPQPGVDVVTDLSQRWPFLSDSVDEVKASHIFEHLPDTLHTMSELFRVLKAGGVCRIDVPSSNGMGAFQDPTHKSFWNINTFLYFDKNRALGGMYDCNVWEVNMVQEYNVVGIESFGPYVMAEVRKPKC